MLKKRQIPDPTDKDQLVYGFPSPDQPTLIHDNSLVVGNNLLLVDASNNRVGINIGNPEVALHLGGSLRVSGTVTANSISLTKVNLNVGPVGNDPNPNGINVGTIGLSLQPTDGIFPGVMTTTSQMIGGVKNFINSVTLDSLTPSMPLAVDVDKNIISSNISLSSQTSNVLPVVNGGTGAFLSNTGNPRNVVSNNGVFAKGLLSRSGLVDFSGATISGLTASPVAINLSVENVWKDPVSSTESPHWSVLLKLYETSFVVTSGTTGTISPNLGSFYFPFSSVEQEIAIKNQGNIILGRININSGGTITISGFTVGAGTCGLLNTCIRYVVD